MNTLRKYLPLISMLLLDLPAGSALRAEAPAPSTPSATPPTEAKREGYTIAVEFFVDSAGTVTNAKVSKSEEAALDAFALQAAQSGQLNPSPLPPVGSPPQKVSSEAFFAVDNYNAGKPLPPGVVLPVPKFQPSPAYPSEYRRKKITGGVWLSIAVGKSGRVGEINVIKSSHPDFVMPAMQAVSKWQFKPATLNGKPIQVTVNVSVAFQIQGQGYGWHWLVAPAPGISGFAAVTD